MSDPKYHDRHTASIYRAIALRFYCRYVEMRNSAEHEGGDLSAHGRLPTERDAADQYTASVEAWLWEAPASGDSGARAGRVRRGRDRRSVSRRGAARSDNGRGTRRLLSDGRAFHGGRMAQQAGDGGACR